MRISDWSSDVCSSDLAPGRRAGLQCRAARPDALRAQIAPSRHPALARRKSRPPADRSMAARYSRGPPPFRTVAARLCRGPLFPRLRSEEHTSELQPLMRISYAVFLLKKKKTNNQT